MMRIVRRLWHLARRDSVALMGANLNYALIGVITGIVTARVLGVEGRGDLAVVVFWPTLIATLLELGVGDALTLWVAREVDNIRGNLRGVLLLTAAVSAIGVVAGLVLLPYVLRSEQHRLLSTAYLCLGLIPAYLLSLVPTGALLGLRRFHAVALVRIASTFAYLLTVIAVVVTHQGTVVSFMWLNVLARFFPLLIGFCLLVPALAGTKHGRLNVIGPLQDGAKLHASKLATVLSSSEDRAIANWTLSQAAIGQWQVASTLTFIIPFIAQGVSQHLYGSIPASSTEQRATITGAAYTRAVVFTAALALVVIPALPFAIPLVYGSDFAGAVMPSMIVVVAGIFSAGTSVLQSSARAMLQTRICVESELLGVVVTAAIAWLLIPRFELSGLAFSVLVGRAFTLVWLASRGHITTGWIGRDLFPSSAAFKRRALLEWRKIAVSHEGPKT